jgi:hypothetical protein
LALMPHARGHASRSAGHIRSQQLAIGLGLVRPGHTVSGPAAAVVPEAAAAEQGIRRRPEPDDRVGAFLGASQRQLWSL